MYTKLICEGNTAYRAQVICSRWPVPYSSWACKFLLFFLFHFSVTSCYWGAFGSFVDAVHTEELQSTMQVFPLPCTLTCLQHSSDTTLQHFFPKVEEWIEIWRNRVLRVLFRSTIRFSVIRIFNRNCANFDFFPLYNDRTSETLSSIYLRAALLYMLI